MNDLIIQFKSKTAYEDKEITKRRKLSTFINSICLSLAICSGAVALLLASLGLAFSYITFFIYLISVLTSYTTTFLLKNKIHIYKYSIFFFLLLVLLFLFNFLFRNNNATSIKYFIQFLGIGTPMLMLSFLEVDYKKTLVFVMFSGVLLSPFLYFIKQYSVLNTFNYDVLEMGTSYVLLLPISATIIHIFFYFEKKVWIIFPYAFNFGLSLFWIRYSVRGSLLAAALLLLFLIMKKILLLERTKRINAAIIFTCVIALSFLLIMVLLPFVANLLEKNEINISFLNKTILLFQRSGSITNGRDDIYNHVLSLIQGHVIFGRGIGFYQETFDTYPHNIILHLLLELGIIAVLAFFLYLFVSFYVFFSNDKQIDDEKPLLIIAFFGSVPRLLLSSYFWQEHIFWLSVFLLIAVVSKKMDRLLMK